MKKKLFKATGLLLLMMVVGSAWGQTLLIENFDYPIGTNLTSVGWTAHNGGGTQPIDVTNGLTYTGYLGSGIGGAANLDNTGEDDNKSFTVQNSGTMYYAFLVNVNVGTAGYFLHLLKNSTTFSSRIFVKPSATSGKINFGISNTSTASFATPPTDFDPDVTYLLIVKYDVSTSGDGSLWVIPSGVPATEILAGTPEIDITGSGQASIEAIALRQYSSSQRIVVDGIRVGNTWTDITGTTWTGASDHDWATAGNWTNNLPDANVDVLIPTGASNYPTISVAATCNNINIEDGASLIGTENLTVSGTAIMQRTIPAYTTSADGWHLLSSPVNNMTIAGSDFEPGTVSPNLDDFYAFSESTYEWLNYKVGANNITNFVNGTGYLVSYETTSTKDFTGTLNAADIPLTNLSKTAGKGNGWHLLGNPFQSALHWTNNSSTWNPTAIGIAAKILNSGGSYTDITYDLVNQYIPANQGFFVQATNATNSLTIPLDERTHNSTAFYKSSVQNLLTLKASDGEFYVETSIQMMEGATEGYDAQFDVNFLGGMYHAPYLYSRISNDGELSTNRIAPVNEQTTVPLAFKAFLNGEYTITASNASSFGDEIEVILEDTQENIQIDLKDTLTYTFMATADELTERFVVHFFNFTGISETTHPESVQIYSFGNRIYLHSELNAYGDVTIYNLLGQNVYHTPVELSGLQSFSLNLNKGWYVVQVVTKQGVKSKKVFIN